MTSQKLSIASRVSTLLVTLIFINGCVSPQKIPTKDHISGIHTIEVVAMESPPLDISGEYFGLTDVGYLFGPGVYGPGTGVLVVIGGIVALINYSMISDEVKSKLESYRTSLSDNNTWIPTIHLADIAANSLKSKGNFNVLLRSDVINIPEIKNRASTVLMENWLAPIREWYNANPSPLHYVNTQEVTADAILEVGILNYEIYDGNFMVSILIKLVDSKTGNIIGRTRNFAMIPVGKPDDLFRAGPKQFKEIFSKTGSMLIEDSIEKIIIRPTALTSAY